MRLPPLKAEEREFCDAIERNRAELAAKLAVEGVGSVEVEGVVMRGIDLTQPIKWTEPLAMRMGEGGIHAGLVCRICIARLGLSGNDLHRLMSQRQWEDHMLAEHCDPWGS